MATFLSTSRGLPDDALDFGSGLLHKLGVIDDVPKVVVQMPTKQMPTKQMPTKQMRLFNGGGLTVKQKYPTDIPVYPIRNNTGQRVLPLNLGTKATSGTAKVLPMSAETWRMMRLQGQSDAAQRANSLRVQQVAPVLPPDPKYVQGTTQYLKEQARKLNLANVPTQYALPPNNTPKFFSSVVDDASRAVRNVADTAGRYIPTSFGNAGRLLGAGLSALNPIAAINRDLNEGYTFGDGISDLLVPLSRVAGGITSALTPSPLGNSDRYSYIIGKDGNVITNPIYQNIKQVPQPVVQPPVRQQVQVPADEYTVGSSLYRQPVRQQIPQPVAAPIAVRAAPIAVRQTPARQVPQQVYQMPVQVTQPDTSFLNLGGMGNADIHPDYRGMSRDDAIALANQRADAKVAAYNQPVQVQQIQQPQQPQVDYNAILQAQAQQMQQQQEQSRFFEERPENLFWDPLTEQYVTSQQYYR